MRRSLTTIEPNRRIVPITPVPPMPRSLPGLLLRGADAGAADAAILRGVLNGIARRLRPGRTRPPQGGAGEQRQQAAAGRDEAAHGAEPSAASDSVPAPEARAGTSSR